jgi:hypothetical protein
MSSNSSFDEERMVSNRFANIRMDSPVPSLESASSFEGPSDRPAPKRKATEDNEEEEGSSKDFTHMTEDDWIYGKDTEDEENPILEDEKETTDPDFCWACTMASFQDKTPMATYWAEKIMPLFRLVDQRYAVLTIRDTYNRLVRPKMDPKIKQRWTKRKIWEHMRFHLTDVPQMLDHSTRKVSRIMEQAERELMVVKGSQKTLNVDAVKMYFDGTRLLHKLLPKKESSRKSSSSSVNKPGFRS